MPAEGSGVGVSVTAYNLSCTLGTDEPLRSAFLLTASPSALFPVSPLLPTAFEKISSSVQREDEGGPPAESRRLGQLVGEFVLFFHLAPLLFCSSPLLLPVCRHKYELSGHLIVDGISKLSRMNEGLRFSQLLSASL